MSTVNVGFYLIVGQHFKDSGYSDGKPSVRTAKTKPSCAPHEVAIWISASLPEALFKRPRLQVQITVPDAQVPLVITPDVQHDIARVVREQLGITLQVFAPADEVQS